MGNVFLNRLKSTIGWLLELIAATYQSLLKVLAALLIIAAITFAKFGSHNADSFAKVAAHGSENSQSSFLKEVDAETAFGTYEKTTTGIDYVGQVSSIINASSDSSTVFTDLFSEKDSYDTMCALIKKDMQSAPMLFQNYIVEKAKSRNASKEHIQFLTSNSLRGVLQHEFVMLGIHDEVYTSLVNGENIDFAALKLKYGVGTHKGSLSEIDHKDLAALADSIALRERFESEVYAKYINDGQSPEEAKLNAKILVKQYSKEAFKTNSGCMDRH